MLDRRPGFTEATGVTNLRATVIRIFTPEGTLVVEVDDPAVKVTIEGDGGLVITGAGLQEVRLQPGSYKVQGDQGRQAGRARKGIGHHHARRQAGGAGKPSRGRPWPLGRSAVSWGTPIRSISWRSRRMAATW